MAVKKTLVQGKLARKQKEQARLDAMNKVAAAVEDLNDALVDVDRIGGIVCYFTLREMDVPDPRHPRTITQIGCHVGRAVHSRGRLLDFSDGRVIATTLFPPPDRR